MNALALRPAACQGTGQVPCGGPQVPSLWEQVRPMTVADFRTIGEATQTLVNGPKYSASGLGAAVLTEQQKQDAMNVLAVAGVMILARGVAGWYVGSKMGRPTSGAILGSIFGPVGLGVLSFWRK